MCRDTFLAAIFDSTAEGGLQSILDVALNDGHVRSGRLVLCSVVQYSCAIVDMEQISAVPVPDGDRHGPYRGARQKLTRHMRRDNLYWMSPIGILAWQRLLGECVQKRSADLIAVERHYAIAVN